MKAMTFWFWLSVLFIFGALFFDEYRIKLLIAAGFSFLLAWMTAYQLAKENKRKLKE